MVAVGVYAHRFNEQTPSDYFVAGKRIGLVVLTFTILASIQSAFTFFGIGANASGAGLGVYVFILLNAVALSLIIGVAGTKFQLVGVAQDLLTPTEYVRDRYESNSIVIVYLLSTGVFLLTFVATQIAGGGIALEVLLGIPYEVSIVLIALFMAFYLHVAGMRGVVWSDTIQGVIIFASLVLGFILVNVQIGGPEIVNSVQSVDPALFSLQGPISLWTPLFTLTFALYFTAGVPAYPHLIQRYLAAGNTDIVKKSGVIYAILASTVLALAALLGLYAFGMMPEIANRDYLIPRLFETITHPVVFGIVVSAAIAALMSTADSVLLTVSSMITHDVYREFFDSDISNEREVRVTQVFLILSILIALVIAWLQPAGIFALGALSVAAGAVTAPAVFMGLYWEGGTAEGAIFSMITGVVVMIAYFFEFIPTAYRFGMHYGFIGTAVTFAVYIIVSFLTETPSDNRVEAYTEG
ncbi:sodium:solute symporter family transporter [Halobellus sp. GM3]|uniref:sodium:solute symporter family transporter n=1 Tax=Halobellus sp. GM3 TaxID=3458410 RepID=UPI00403E0B99